MIISYHNHEFFKVQFGDTILAFNPISKDSKLKGARFGADVALSSLNHPDFNGVENVTFGERAPLAIFGPGEYEVKGVFVRGFSVKTTYEKEDRIATLYLVNLEGMNLCFAGPIKTREFDKNLMAALEEIDVLFVPIEGGESEVKPVDKLTLKKKDLEGKEGEIVVLAPQI